MKVLIFLAALLPHICSEPEDFACDVMLGLKDGFGAKHQMRLQKIAAGESSLFMTKIGFSNREIERENRCENGKLI